MLISLLNQGKDHRNSQLNQLFQKTPPSLLPFLQEQQQQQPTRKVPEIQEDQADRTVFVGNLSIETSKKQLQKLFRGYGKIVKVRFRSVPLEQNKLPKKANFILKKFDTEKNSMNAYVTFQKTQQACKALQANDTLFKEKHIRVTMENQKQLDYQTTAFVGNLPFAAEQQEVRQFFQQCGRITGCRVVKNKGIAYVTGADKQVLKKMMNLSGQSFKQRELRVKKAVSKVRLEKKQRWREKKHQQYVSNKQANRETRVAEAIARRKALTAREGGQAAANQTTFNKSKKR